MKLKSEATYLRDQAQEALHLARDSTNQVVVNTLIEVAVESLGRAGAIELIESLQEAATAWGYDRSLEPRAIEGDRIGFGRLAKGL